MPDKHRAEQNLYEVGVQTRNAYAECEEYDARVRKAYTTSTLCKDCPVIQYDSKRAETVKTKISIVNEDTINAAISLHKTLSDSGLIGVMNFASDYQPGGGFLRQAQAQEESICRRTTLFPCLNTKRDSLYPIPKRSVIVSPDVFVFRYDKHRDWKFIPWSKTFFITVISAAAIRNPRIQQDGHYTKADFHHMLATMKETLRVAYQYGVTHLILGAWGSGAFHHPPHLVADMFKFVLNSREFRNVFKEIIFAVYDTTLEKNTFKAFEQSFM